MTETTGDLFAPTAEEKLTNPELFKHIWAVGPNSIDGYLMGLAAVQRGLLVVFYGDSLSARGAIGGGAGGKSAFVRLLTISDTRKTYFFMGTGSVLTTKKMHVLSRHKGAAKALFLRHNVPTPNGYMASKSSLSKLAAFLQVSPSETFVVKPIDGSLGNGVLVGLSKAEVMAHVVRRGAKQTIVEEVAKGPEYRVCVVDGRIAAAYERLGIYVIGDGRSTIAQLIAVRNQRRAQNPNLRKGPIDPLLAVQYLYKTGLTVTHVPNFGEKVILRDGKNVNQGGTSRNAMLTLPKPVVLAAIAACKALEMPMAGLDIIDTVTGPSVLELNALPHVASHSFPYEGIGSGNAVAEAIVDLYFPQNRVPRDLTIAIDGANLIAAFRKDGIKTVYPAQLITV